VARAPISDGFGKFLVSLVWNPFQAGAYYLDAPGCGKRCVTAVFRQFSEIFFTVHLSVDQRPSLGDKCDQYPTSGTHSRPGHAI